MFEDRARKGELVIAGSSFGWNRATDTDKRMLVIAADEKTDLKKRRKK
jgi:hypothetical protein